MIRVIGFLSGVCLSVAALLLVLDREESPPPESVTQVSGDATAAELSGLLAAIAEQVDVAQVPLQQAEGMADAEAQNALPSTQVPVEVVSAGPGKYRVAFSYRDETERLAQIKHIETVTGLKLE